MDGKKYRLKSCHMAVADVKHRLMMVSMNLVGFVAATFVQHAGMLLAIVAISVLMLKIKNGWIE